MVSFIISQNFIMRITMWQIASWVIEGEKRKRYTQLMHYQINYDSVEKMETEGNFHLHKNIIRWTGVLKETVRVILIGPGQVIWGQFLEGTQKQERSVRTALNHKCLFLRKLSCVLKLFGQFAIGKNSKFIKIDARFLHFTEHGSISLF